MDWSPDSRRFAHFTVELKAESTQLHVVDPYAPTDEAAIEVSGTVESLTWSPDGSRLGLTSRVGQHQTLFVLGSDGANLQQLDSRIAAFVGPFKIVGWLTPQSILVFENCDQASGVPVVYELVKPERRQFDIRPIGTSSVEISPSRSAIAWNDHCGYPGVNDGLWTLDLKSGNAGVVSEACRLSDLSWSPDGQEIAYTRLDSVDINGTVDDAGGLYIIDVESKAARRLTNPSGAEEAGVEWRQDGSGFLLSRNFNPDCAGECPRHKLILVSPDGQETPVKEADAYPKDERGALFEADDGLRFASADGSEQRLLFGAREEWEFIQPGFSPDGRWITFVRYYCGDCTIP